MDLSVVIVSWNTRQILDDCLASVYRETTGIDFEVIVVDNCSEDGSVAMVRQKYPDVQIIANQSNLGFAAANNIGFEVCRGDYVLLLNSDTLVLDGAISRTLAYAQSKPDYGVIACRVLNQDGSLQPNCSRYPSLVNNLLFVSGLYKALPRNRFFGRAKMTWWNYEGERDVEVVSGCFMLVKAQALQQVGAMDERYFMYSEEVDWCYRFNQAGWKLGYFPGANIIHLGGASAARLGGSRALVKDRSTRRYMKKHWSRPAYYLGLALMFTFYLTRLPGALLLALVRRTKASKVKLENHWIGLRGLISQRDI